MSTPSSEPRQNTRDAHESIRGTQQASIAFGFHCEDAGARTSIEWIVDGYDSAHCDRLFSALDYELVGHRSFRSEAEARMTIVNFIEGFNNPRRRQPALDSELPVR